MINNEFNFNGPVSGQVAGVNQGTMQQDLIEYGVDPKILELMEQLMNDPKTQKQATSISEDIESLSKQKDSIVKKSILGRIVEKAQFLVKLAETSATLAPVAVKIYEYFSNISF